MNKCFSDVLAFHRKFGAVIGSTPAVPDEATVILRYRLIREEQNELVNAMIDNDLPGIAKEITDSIYVLVGTAISYGISLPEVWDAVQAANLSKSQDKRGDGKVQKGENYISPDIAGILARQVPIDDGGMIDA